VRTVLARVGRAYIGFRVRPCTAYHASRNTVSRMICVFQKMHSCPYSLKRLYALRVLRKQPKQNHFKAFKSMRNESSPPKMAFSSLSSLVEIISSNAKVLESAYAGQGTTYPSLDESYLPTSLNNDPTVVESSRLIVAAAYQIIAMVRPPVETVQEYSTGPYASVALGALDKANVPTILKKADKNVSQLFCFDKSRKLSSWTGYARQGNISEKWNRIGLSWYASMVN
jgi:hypothetical protein